MKLIKISILILITSSFRCFALSQKADTNSISINIETLDIVENESISYLHLVVNDKLDSSYFYLDSNYSISLLMKSSNELKIMVLNPNYQFIETEIPLPPNINHISVEFHLLKDNLSNREKIRAIKNSRNRLKEPCFNCGGFQQVVPKMSEVCLIRNRYFYNRKLISASYDFQKIKF